MKIYTEYNTESDSAEVSLNYQELEALTNALIKFKDKVKEFKIKNKDKDNLGFTHLHFPDCMSIDKNNPNLVFYINLDEE